MTDLVLIYESVTSSASVVRWLTLHSWPLNSLNSLTTESLNPLELNWTLSLSLTLRPMVSRPPSGAYEQIFYYCQTVAGLLIWGALSDERTGLSFTVQLALASAVILGFKSLGTCDHILLSQIWDFPFHRLLRLAGLQWRYSTPPPHGNELNSRMTAPFYNFRRNEYKSPCLTVPLLFCFSVFNHFRGDCCSAMDFSAAIRCSGNVITEPLFSNGRIPACHGNVC
jgi:hypothetical protein